MDKKMAFLDHLPLLKGWAWNTNLCLCHAIHETGDFAKTCGAWNCWGIKVPHQVEWHGLVVEVPTEEIIDGKRIKVVDKFVDFPNVEAALSYYDSFIARVYPGAYAIRGMDDPLSYVTYLAHHGYATEHPQVYIDAFMDRWNAL